MKIRSLVTGVAGFIGSHIAETAIKSGYEVIGIDCLTDYYSTYQKQLNLTNLLSNDAFNFIKEDITKVDLHPLLENVDYVFHLAAQPGVRASFGREFEKYLQNNVLATQKLLETCKNLEIKKLVFASSSSVYGNTTVCPTTENAPTQPFSPYGVTKLAAEKLCQVYCKNYDLPIVILRYFTVYGPRQRPDMAFSTFINSILDEKEVTVFGDGTQTRDFTYVDDIVEATLLAATRGPPGEILNIGGESNVSVNDTLILMEKLLEKKIKLVYAGVQKGDVEHTRADIEKAKRILGYRPSWNLEEGLIKQIEWTKGLKKTPSMIYR